MSLRRLYARPMPGCYYNLSGSTASTGLPQVVGVLTAAILISVGCYFSAACGTMCAFCLLQQELLLQDRAQVQVKPTRASLHRHCVKCVGCSELSFAQSSLALPFPGAVGFGGQGHTDLAVRLVVYSGTWSNVAWPRCQVDA